MLQKFLFLCALIIPLFTTICFCQDTASNTQKKAVYIKELYIQGNKKTSLNLIKTYLQLDTGMVCDSSLIKKAKERLRSTDLFLKVDIVTLFKEDGAHVYVILIEGLFLNIYDIGGDYHLRKYRKSDFWMRYHLGVEDKNFRGKMEVLRVQASIWDWKALYLSWLKPVIPTPYFWGMGLGFDQYPDEAQWIDHLSVNGRLYFGRSFSSHVKGYLGVSPYFENMKVYYYDKPLTNDSIATDSTIKLYELFGNVSNVIDYRDNFYDSRKGYYLFTDLKTNSLYSGRCVDFYQLTTDFRYYQTIYGNNRIVTRLFGQFRDKNTGLDHRLQYGAETTIRGYLRGEFPRHLIVSDAMIFSFEYRFPIYQFPTMRVPILWRVDDVFKSLDYRVDGALILDYGRMGTSFSTLFDPDSKNIESGCGLGFGIRVMVPSMEKSGNIDVVWGESPSGERRKFHFYSYPIFHLYIDLLN